MRKSEAEIIEGDPCAASPNLHPVGTCRMRREVDSVVDPAAARPRSRAPARRGCLHHAVGFPAATLNAPLDHDRRKIAAAMVLEDAVGRLAARDATSMALSLAARGGIAERLNHELPHQGRACRCGQWHCARYPVVYSTREAGPRLTRGIGRAVDR